MPELPSSDPASQPASSGPLDIFRRADWLNHDRVLAYSRIFVAVMIFASCGWLAFVHNLMDLAGHPVGIDFLNVYAAGLMANAGNAAGAYDWVAHGAVQHAVVPFDGYLAWLYPPMFLFVAAVLATLPYLPALGVYMVATFSAYVAAVSRLAPDVRGKLWLAAGFPGVFVNLGHGQNGFLTTALLATGVLFVDKRPILAGLAFGAVAYKPQFGLLIPIALLMGGYWRVIFSAGVTVVALSLASLLVFGKETWLAFFGALDLTRTIILEQGGTGWEKIVSVFSAIRMWHGSIGFAYGVQTVVTAMVLLVVAYVWWKSRSPSLKGGILILAIPLTTPYVLDYDLVVLAAGVMLLAREGFETGFRPWEKIVLAMVTVAPVLARMIGTVGVPIVPPVLICAMILFSMRVWQPKV